MKKKMKRLFSCTLVLLMVVSLFPAQAFATGKIMSAEFKAILNKDGKFIMNAAKPESDDQAYWLFNETEYMRETYLDFRFDSFNEDYQNCEITYIDRESGNEMESHTVEIIYNYDKTVKSMVDSMVSKFPEGEEFGGYYFDVKDMELFSWWINSGDINTMINYSGELKTYLNYKNFEIDCRMGMDDYFITEASGIAPFIYDGITYKLVEMGVRGRHIIYVPDDTEATKETLMAAAQKRVDEYAGEGKVKITYGGCGIRDYYDDLVSAEIDNYENLLNDCSAQIEKYDELIEECESNISECEAIICEKNEAINEWYSMIGTYNIQKETDPDNYDFYDEKIQELQDKIDAYILEIKEYSLKREKYQQNIIEYQNAKSTLNLDKMLYEMYLENAKRYKEYVLDAYDNEEGEYYFLQSAAGDYWFNMEIGDESHMFIVVADSESMVNPKYRSSDVATDVVVESTDSSVPLDTRISVSEMESGSKYEEIISLLEVEDNQTYDIKLFSNSLDKYITKLNNGKFEVNIPIKSEFEGKNLIVYYVDENKGIHQYDVTVKDGKASFVTDHFSIYTLAEKSDVEVKDGKAEITNAIIREAITNAGTSDTVEIPLNNVVGEVTSVQIPVVSIKAIADAAKGVALNVSKIAVTLDKKTLEKIVDVAGTDENVELKINEIKKETLTSKQQEAIKDKEVASVISAEIICNNKTISDFGGGKVTLQIPFTPAKGSKGSDYKVIYVSDDGKVEEIATKYENGFIVMELKHFSEYVIVKSNDSSTDTSPETGDSSNVWLWITYLFISAIAIGGTSILFNKK